ncbi:hypothetical protein Tco_0824638 [Tanacetum coccineum]|uniref:Uncharacterized protein n=1 Tax=Tanacetum coccineum TaxID=301880 RepID=A0ABQ5AN40_9ASTR
MEPRVDKCNLLRGGCSDSGISSLRSTGDGMDRDGGSGGSGDGGNAVVTASMRAGGSILPPPPLGVWAVQPRQGAPHEEGGDSDFGGDGVGVVYWSVVSKTLCLSVEGYGSLCGR